MLLLQNALNNASMDILLVILMIDTSENPIIQFQAKLVISKLKLWLMALLKVHSLFIQISQITKVEFIAIPLDLN